MESKAKFTSFADAAAASSTSRDQSSPWQSPPDYFSDLILPRLSYPDHSRFASVCRHWCSLQKSHRLRSAPMLPLPLLLVSTTNPYVIDNPTVFSPIEQRFYGSHPALPLLTNKICLASSPGGWLLLFPHDQIDSLSLSLFNVVTAVEHPLPPETRFAATGSFHFLQAAMSSASSSSPPDLVLVVTRSKQLFLFRQGRSNCWTQLPFVSNCSIRQVIFCGGKFYCKSFLFDHILVVDPAPAKPTVEILSMGLDDADTVGAEALVECNGDVLLVKEVRYYDDQVRLFRADFLKGMFVGVESIGDWMLFVHESSSVSLLATDHSHNKSCVYYGYHSLGEYVQLGLSEESVPPPQMKWAVQRKLYSKAGMVKVPREDPANAHPLVYAYCWVVPS